MRRAAALAGGALLLSGCGQGEVSTGDLEQQVTTQLQREFDRTPAGVSCPDPLPAEVGASVRCELETQVGKRFGLTVATTGVEDGTAQLSISVDEAPLD